MRYTLFLVPGLVVIAAATFASTPQTVVARTGAGDALLAQLQNYRTQLLSLQSELRSYTSATPTPDDTATPATATQVPFYSQFADISAPEWRKVGCGIASVAMLIDYYSDEPVVVDDLLQEGIERGAYLSDAGWTHAGLIGLARDYGLQGESRSLAQLSPSSAFTALKEVVAEGPVMVSVHYTFEPTNPIPHLVVVSDINDGVVHYNDPAEPHANGTISAQKFIAAWKQRYISIRPDARLAQAD